MSEKLLKKDERGMRMEAVHMRGVDNMSTEEVFAYFKQFSPGSVEWIDDSSCKSVFYYIWIKHILI